MFTTILLSIIGILASLFSGICGDMPLIQRRENKAENVQVRKMTKQCSGALAFRPVLSFLRPRYVVRLIIQFIGRREEHPPCKNWVLVC